MPESPVWLISANENDKARAVLHWLRRDSKEADLEFSTLEEAFHEKTKVMAAEVAEDNLPKKAVKCLHTLYSNIRMAEVYKPFLILLLFFLIQEGSGVYIFLFYAVSVLKDLGTCYEKNIIVITMGVLRLLTAILGSYLMTKFGRRSLSLFSGASMSFSILVITLYFPFESSLKENFSFIPVLGVFLHVGFSMTGFLQIPWVLNGELFPSHCRGVMVGITGSIAYLFIFVSIKTYPALASLIEIQGVLWVCFIITGIGVLLLALVLPETKDKTLQEISGFFKKVETAHV